MRRIIPLLLLLFILSACGTKIEQKQSVEVQETLETVTENAYLVLQNSEVLQRKGNVDFTFDGEKIVDYSLETTMQLEPYLYHELNDGDDKDEDYVTKEDWYKRVGSDAEWHYDTRDNANSSFGAHYLYEAIELEGKSLIKLVEVKDYVSFEEKTDAYHITFSSNDQEVIKTYLKNHLLNREIDSNNGELTITSLEENTVIDKGTFEVISRRYTIHMNGKITENQTEDAVMQLVINMTEYNYSIEELQIPELVIEQAKATASKAKGVKLINNASKILYGATSIRSETEMYIYVENKTDVLETSFYLYNVQDTNPNFKGYMYYEDAETFTEMQYDRNIAYFSEGDVAYWQEMEPDPTLLENQSLELAKALVEIQSIADNLKLSESPDAYFINIKVEKHSENVLRYLVYSNDFQEIINAFGGVPTVNYLEENYTIDKETGELYAMEGIYELSLDDKFMQIQYAAAIKVNDVTEDDFYVIE